MTAILEMDEETTAEAGNTIYSLIAALDGVNVEAAVAALTETLELARMQMETAA